MTMPRQGNGQPPHRQQHGQYGRNSANGAASGAAPARSLTMPADGAGLLGRVQPQALDAEMSVLGALMLGRSDTAERCAEILRDGGGDFYREAHGYIYDACLALAGRGVPIDPVTLRDELTHRPNPFGIAGGGNLLDAAGGMAYLLTLADFMPTASNAEHYAAIVRDKAIKRRLIEAAAIIAGNAYGDEEDADTLKSAAESLLYGIGTAVEADSLHALSAILGTEMDAIEARGNRTEALVGIDTGFAELNMFTQGQKAETFTIIAARPSMGKTAQMADQALASAKVLQRRKEIWERGEAVGDEEDTSGSGGHPGTVAVFSLEMSRDQIAQRIISREARIDGLRIQSGKLYPGEWERVAEAVARLWTYPLYIDDSTGLTVDDMRARLRRLAKRQGPPRVVFVDYLQIMASPRYKGRAPMNRNEELTEIGRGLKNMAREFKCSVVALSQLSRAVERRDDKRPMLSDLRESGGLEAEADVVEMLFRPAYYARKPEASEALSADGIEEAELIIAKQRNGPTGIIKLGFVPRFATFTDIDRTHEGMF